MADHRRDAQCDRADPTPTAEPKPTADPTPSATVALQLDGSACFAEDVTKTGNKFERSVSEVEGTGATGSTEPTSTPTTGTPGATTTTTTSGGTNPRWHHIDRDHRRR